MLQPAPVSSPRPDTGELDWRRARTATATQTVLVIWKTYLRESGERCLLARLGEMSRIWELETFVMARLAAQTGRDVPASLFQSVFWNAAFLEMLHLMHS